MHTFTPCTHGSRRQWRDGWERGCDLLRGLMYSHLAGHHFPSRTVIVSESIQVAAKPRLGLIVIMHSWRTHISESKLNINLTTIKSRVTCSGHHSTLSLSNTPAVKEGKLCMVENRSKNKTVFLQKSHKKSTVSF